MKKEGLKWATLTEEERNEIVDPAGGEVSADYGNTILKSSARNEYMIQAHQENDEKNRVGSAGAAEIRGV